MHPPSHAVGPASLGFVASGASLSADGWIERRLEVPLGLDGPPGVLQGGTCVGLLVALAGLEDVGGLPASKVVGRLHRPTLLGSVVTTRVRSTDQFAEYDVEVTDDGGVLVTGRVELAGHLPVTHAHDLASLAQVAVPEPEKHQYVDCWVCGSEPHHPYAQRMYPSFLDRRTVLSRWVADPLDDPAAESVHPLVVSSVLDCPTATATIDHVAGLGLTGPLLGTFRVQFLRDTPLMEPLRVVGMMDGVERRKVYARGAIVDDDGIVYAVASAVHIAVDRLPVA